MIYSLRAQPEVNELHINEVPKNKGLIFDMGEVSELRRKTMANNSGGIISSLTIIPRARMGCESIVHEAEGRMGY